MQLEFAPNCQKKLAAIKGRDTTLFKLVSKQLVCFQQQPSHPSLRLHKLKGNLENSWSISINKSIRMIFYYRQVGNQIRAVFIAIGTHAEVYV